MIFPTCTSTLLKYSFPFVPIAVITNLLVVAFVPSYTPSSTSVPVIVDTATLVVPPGFTTQLTVASLETGGVLLINKVAVPVALLSSPAASIALNEMTTFAVAVGSTVMV